MGSYIQELKEKNKDFDWELKSRFLVTYPPQGSWGYLKSNDLTPEFWENVRGAAHFKESKETVIWGFIPFCKTKCRFCWFPTTSRMDDDFRRTYLSLLKQDIARRGQTSAAKRAIVKYFSLQGGTPTLLPLQELKDLIDCFKQNFHFTADTYGSIEVTPDSLLDNEEKVAMLKEAGIHELRIGVQSFDPQITKMSTRSHTSEQAIKAVQLVKKYGLNASIDIILGFPGHTLKIVENDIRIVNEIKPDRVTILNLQLTKPTTIGYGDVIGKQPLPSLDAHIEMQKYVMGSMEKLGYRQTTIATYATEKLSKIFCIYRACWSELNLFSFGPFTFSFVDNTLAACPQSVEDYMQLVPQMEIPFVAGRIDKGDDMMRRWVIYHFHVGELDKNEFQRKFGLDFSSFFQKPVAKMLKLGMLVDGPQTIKVTPLGRVFVVNMSREFYDKLVQEDLLANAQRQYDENDISIKIFRSFY
jgi:oxygen-independent coproporphyrinogen-3 oxidase